MSVLYVAVDESGLPTEGRCYTLVGCWYTSDRRDPTEPLSGLKDDLLQYVATKGRESAPVELKGGKMSAETATGVIDRVERWMWDLETVNTSSLPWQRAHPLGFTRAVYQPSAARRIIEQMSVHRTETPNVLKELALNALLTPLFHDHFSDDYVETRVILDGDPWVKPGHRTKRRWNQLPGVSDVPTFETRDSKAVPGIQIADVAAITWRRHVTDGRCNRAAATLHEYQVTR